MNSKKSKTTCLVAGVVALLALNSACSLEAMPGSVSAAAAGPAGGTRIVSITDPNLNMRAYSLSIPADWVFLGMVEQGTPCAVGAFPIIRIISPDGLTGMKLLPRLDWAWSDGRNFQPKPNSACLPYKREMPASEVLKYMIGVLQVQYVRDEPTPQLADIRRNAAARSTAQFSTTVDMAAARVRYHIHKIDIDEVVNVLVNCTAYDVMMIGRQHNCSAYTTRTWAPQGQYSDPMFKAISKSMTIDQQWNARWNAVMAQRIQAMAEQSGQAVRAMGDQMAQQRNAQQAQWQQAQDMRNRQHEEFMATLQRGTDISMQRAAQGANARSQAADDWCDFALDQQKRMDPNTGVISKDSSAYTYTWVSQSGQRIQTNDVNANPNGNGTGNWTLQQNIR
jgi:hypothetical protein